MDLFVLTLSPIACRVNIIVMGPSSVGKTHATHICWKSMKQIWHHCLSRDPTPQCSTTVEPVGKGALDIPTALVFHTNRWSNWTMIVISLLVRVMRCIWVSLSFVLARSMLQVMKERRWVGNEQSIWQSFGLWGVDTGVLSCWRQDRSLWWLVQWWICREIKARGGWMRRWY